MLTTLVRIVLAAIIVGAFFIFLIFACITARRRRRMGQNPYRGTGWAAGSTPAGHAPAQYTGGAQSYYANNNAPPPVYSPQTQGYYNPSYNNPNANQGYFGGQQQHDVELQQPENAYARGGGNDHFPVDTSAAKEYTDNVYQPPAGPPSGKTATDGIIR